MGCHAAYAMAPWSGAEIKRTAVLHTVTQAQYAEFVHATGYRTPAIRELPLVVAADSESSFRELAGAYAWRGGDPPRDRGQHPASRSPLWRSPRATRLEYTDHHILPPLDRTIP